MNPFHLMGSAIRNGHLNLISPSRGCGILYLDEKDTIRAGAKSHMRFSHPNKLNRICFVKLLHYAGKQGDKITFILKRPEEKSSSSYNCACNYFPLRSYEKGMPCMLRNRPGIQMSRKKASRHLIISTLDLRGVYSCSNSRDNRHSSNKPEYLQWQNSREWHYSSAGQ